MCGRWHPESTLSGKHRLKPKPKLSERSSSRGRRKQPQDKQAWLSISERPKLAASGRELGRTNRKRSWAQLGESTTS